MSGAAYLSTTARAVLRRWRKGHDTWMLGRHFGIEEAEVCRILAADQDRRHRNKVAAARHRERMVQLGLSPAPTSV